MKWRINNGQVRKWVFAKVFVKVGQSRFDCIEVSLRLMGVLRLHHQLQTDKASIGSFPLVFYDLKMGRGCPGKINDVFGMVQNSFGAVAVQFFGLVQASSA